MADKAWVETRMTYDGKYFFSNFTLVKENGAWLIAGNETRQAPYPFFVSRESLPKDSFVSLQATFKKRPGDMSYKKKDTETVSYYFYPKELRVIPDSDLVGFGCVDWRNGGFNRLVTSWRQDETVAPVDYGSDDRLQKIRRDTQKSEHHP